MLDACNRKTTNRDEAFTLVEVLAVISIIALLAALLEPALVGALRSAKTSNCQSNLRQIGIAFHAYGVDWDDHYPSAIDAWTRVNNEARSDYPEPFAVIPDM